MVQIQEGSGILCLNTLRLIFFCCKQIFSNNKSERERKKKYVRKTRLYEVKWIFNAIAKTYTLNINVESSVYIHKLPMPSRNLCVLLYCILSHIHACLGHDGYDDEKKKTNSQMTKRVEVKKKTHYSMGKTTKRTYIIIIRNKPENSEINSQYAIGIEWNRYETVAWWSIKHVTFRSRKKLVNLSFHGLYERNCCGFNDFLHIAHNLCRHSERMVQYSKFFLWLIEIMATQ